MKKLSKLYLSVVLLASCFQSVSQIIRTDLEKNFLNPSASAKPWVFWYWMNAAVSKEGIATDLEAMKQVGVGGAYLMPIKDTSSAIPFQPTARQLTPEWWRLVKFAMQEARRLNLKLAMHVSDGFALAGGPWITPQLSMQKLVWTKTYIKADITTEIKLTKPRSNENYYNDIAIFAYPANSSNAFSNLSLIPGVTTSNGEHASFLPDITNQKESFKTDTTCWIEYTYPQSFTCRSIKIHTGGNNYQAQRLIVQTSDDGINFKTIIRLEPPRHGWQDVDEDVTHSIPVATAKYFRFVFNKEGSEPGAEDLDAAKWKPSLKVMGIYLSDEPVIHQYESKNGSIWRVSKNTMQEQLPDTLCVPLKSIINLSGKMDNDGSLHWKPESGNWVIVRIGHTSTAHKNETGGAGKGLECDKFNPVAIKLQFDNWFAKAFGKTDKDLAKEVLKVFHVDSWECGSQNWSPVFANEFKKRRGYDLTPYLLSMTGVPLENTATSEKFLHDVRETIAELVNDVFYVTLNKLAHEKGCSFSAESIAPTMVSDGMLHYKTVDIPMGEFWLNSPTHDKPNDMLDAISGAHIYGKNIIQAEAFTSLRMNWGEHPGNIKALGDRNFALGINRMVIHVFTHNPWMDRKPGMTLDGVGLYFQRDQTWLKQSKAWIDYLTRCQAMLQMGNPVVDIAVFTGEEIPRRSVLPDRLLNTLPGIFGKAKIAEEKNRLANIGEPLRTIPDGVTHSANMAGPEDWIDPLTGYTYDCINPDAIMQMSVDDGRLLLPHGASYKILVIPARHPMNPNSSSMSLTIAKKILQLVKNGATIIMSNDYLQGIGLRDNDAEVQEALKELMKQDDKKGKVILIPYTDSSFAKLGLQRDVEIENNNHSIAWAHRKMADADIYFISNQKNSEQFVKLSFRVSGKMPEIWDPVNANISGPITWKIKNEKTFISQNMEANQSLFIIFKKESTKQESLPLTDLAVRQLPFSNKWKVQFDKNYGGPPSPVILDELYSWSNSSDPAIKYYSGTAVYSNTFNWEKKNKNEFVRIKFDSIYNMATIKVNGIDCGSLWTKPYSLDITKAIKAGENKIEVEVTNTWHNRLIGDNLLPEQKRITWTTAPFRLKDKPLLPAGLTGNIILEVESN